jgi:GNAT superfamily N-acetyltransferase
MKQVLERIRELAVYEKEPEAVVITEADLIRDGFSDTPLFKCLVAEEKDTLLGIALFYFRYSTWKGKTIHLEDLIVKESERGRGIGMALYREVIRRGQEEGVRRIEWAVLDWNTPAIRFYEKSGARVLPDWRVVQMDENGIATFLGKKGIIFKPFKRPEKKNCLVLDFIFFKSQSS